MQLSSRLTLLSSPTSSPDILSFSSFLSYYNFGQKYAILYVISLTVSTANQEVAGTVQDTYHFDHHEDGTSDASKLGALSFIVASAAYLLM